MEELDQFSGPEEIRSVNQSLLRGGPVFWCFGSYNPPQSANNWVNEEMLLDQPDRLVHHSDYRQVPADWLGAQFLEDADRLRQRNERAYRHEYLGEVTGTGGTVFENVQERRLTDEEVSHFDRRRYGLDFGFAVDPLAFVCMHYDRRNSRLYIFDEIYQPKLTNSRAAAMIYGKMTENYPSWASGSTERERGRTASIMGSGGSSLSMRSSSINGAAPIHTESLWVMNTKETGTASLFPPTRIRTTTPSMRYGTAAKISCRPKQE